jgi:hypothetical protein
MIAFMDIRPMPHVAKKLKELAQKEGISYNAFIVPFLNDIAAGRLVRVPYYPPPAQNNSTNKPQ